MYPGEAPGPDVLRLPNHQSMENFGSRATATALLQLVQPEVQKYLEAVYAVAPVPGEYVRYRLHLATALPLDLLDAWFDLRRKTGLFNQDVDPNTSSTGSQRPETEKPRFSLFGSSEEPGLKGPDEPHGDSARTVPPTYPSAFQGSTDQTVPRLVQQDTPDGSLNRTARTDSGSLEDDASMSSRFNESDLEAVSSLVGLEVLTSAQQHCGSSSLFLFEQLTALDSLDMEGKSSSKRRRTRHQHFWRNTDKLDTKERVYIPTSSIRPALDNNEPVVPKMDIGPDERTNAWTVCLTTQGVVSYLNKRISPLGVQVIRALQKQNRDSATRIHRPKTCSAGIGFDAAMHDHSGTSSKQAASDQGGSAQQRSSLAHTNDSESDSPEAAKRHKAGSKSEADQKDVDRSHQPNNEHFEPIPRARRRKPQN